MVPMNSTLETMHAGLKYTDSSIAPDKLADFIFYVGLCALSVVDLLFVVHLLIVRCPPLFPRRPCAVTAKPAACRMRPNAMACTS